jgi:N-acetylmuramoyl-L-alanine amidase
MINRIFIFHVRLVAILSLVLACSVIGSGVLAAAAPKAVKTDVEITSAAEQVIVYFDQPVAPLKHFTLDNPLRLVVDLPALSSGAGIGLSPDYSGSIIHSIRFGRPEPKKSRIVLDLDSAIQPVKITTGTNPPRLIMTLTRDKTARNAAKPEKTKEPVIPLIVIDAGHGGKDIGASGISGVVEKDITLRYAKALRDALQDSGRYKVLLTRDDDEYLFLKDRVQVARDHKADMFISLHADSAPAGDVRGLSVYTLSEKASDEETAALAEQENSSDVIGGIDLAVEDKNVANILLDLAQHETRNKGSEFAETLISNIHPKIPLLGNSHRFAGFRVLKAPDIPSVLVEIGFLSNSEDEARIQSREYQDKVVRSLLSAVDAYWKEKRK